MEVTNEHVDAVIQSYINDYLETNSAAATVRAILLDAGIGLRPVLDHISIRTCDVLERALEFEALGYTYDDRLGVLERDSWWAKVYRKPGYPALYLDQPYTDHRGDDSPIKEWVEHFADNHLHHIAIAVDSIEHAVERYRAVGLKFTGEIMGEPKGTFRQIYTSPEIVDGHEFTVLELIERRWGYTGFLSPLAHEKQV